ncbi:MAG: hypothetical protein JWN49_295 [Parcubacteria group bacterium]|nr:hypothetical protein [Parcubacteria group bacterium]
MRRTFFDSDTSVQTIFVGSFMGRGLKELKEVTRFALSCAHW